MLFLNKVLLRVSFPISPTPAGAPSLTLSLFHVPHVPLSTPTLPYHSTSVCFPDIWDSPTLTHDYIEVWICYRLGFPYGGKYAGIFQLSYSHLSSILLLPEPSILQQSSLFAFLYSCIIFHHIHGPHCHSPFNCCCTSRLFPFPISYEHSSNKHGCASVMW